MRAHREQAICTKGAVFCAADGYIQGVPQTDPLLELQQEGYVGVSMASVARMRWVVQQKNVGQAELRILVQEALHS